MLDAAEIDSRCKKFDYSLAYPNTWYYNRNKGVVAMDIQNTDLETVKNLIKQLLEETQLEVDKSDKNRIVHHPFFSDTVFPIHNPNKSITICGLVDGTISGEAPQGINIIEYPEGLKRAKEWLMGKIDKADSAFDIFALINKNYCFAFLYYVLKLLSRNDLSEILSFIWTSGEETSHYNPFSVSELVQLFGSCNPEALMNEDEYQYYQNLPDELIIYRGILKTNENCIYGLSWTVSQEKAIGFANRFSPRDNEERAVYAAKIKKKDTFAYFSRVDDDEIIVNPEKLYDVKRLQNIE